MLSRCYGYYLVFTGCSNICLTIMWCAHWMLRTHNLLSAKTIVETSQPRKCNSPKKDHHCATLFKPTDAKEEWVAREVKAKYANLIPSRCYNLVYIECFHICLALFGAHWMPRTVFFVRETIVETIQQRIAINPKQIITVLSLHMPADDTNKLSGVWIKQNTQAACSRDVMPTIWCTLNALMFAWRQSAAHWLNASNLNLLSAKTFFGNPAVIPQGFRVAWSRLARFCLVCLLCVLLHFACRWIDCEYLFRRFPLKGALIWHALIHYNTSKRRTSANLFISFTIVAFGLRCSFVIV